jgi:hypothetical protein
MIGGALPDPYQGVTVPNPERRRLLRSVFHSAPLAEVAEAVSVATEQFKDIYLEVRGNQYRWSLATRCGPYPLLRITARFLRMDYCSLVGVGSRVVGDGWCVQIVAETETDPDAWIVLRFHGALVAERVGVKVLTSLRI